jgi:hypothetical protein
LIRSGGEAKMPAMDSLSHSDSARSVQNRNRRIATSLRRTACLAAIVAILTGCSVPDPNADLPMTRYDRETEYRTEDTLTGFTVTINHSRGQLVPDMGTVGQSCRQALVTVAQEIAERRGRRIAPINDSRIRTSFVRNPVTGLTHCSATVPVFWESRR